jgi:hypothetical protein
MLKSAEPLPKPRFVHQARACLRFCSTVTRSITSSWMGDGPSQVLPRYYGFFPFILLDREYRHLALWYGNSLGSGRIRTHNVLVMSSAWPLIWSSSPFTNHENDPRSLIGHGNGVQSPCTSWRIMCSMEVFYCLRKFNQSTMSLLSGFPEWHTFLLKHDLSFDTLHMPWD